MLYEKISNIIIQNGDYILQTGELMNTQLSGWFKYLREEAVPLKESKNLREEAREVYSIRHQ